MTLFLNNKYKREDFWGEVTITPQPCKSMHLYILTLFFITKLAVSYPSYKIVRSNDKPGDLIKKSERQIVQALSGLTSADFLSENSLESCEMKIDDEM